MGLAIRPLTMGTIVIRIFVAVLLGGLIGFERGMKNRPAGLRTYMLVCLGACIVMMTNQYIYQLYETGDLARMGAQVVSGIGFLGAGSIIVTQRHRIRGLTTAAGLWASGCVGLAIGIGLYEVALVGSVMVFLILTLLHHLDQKMRRRTREVEAYIELQAQSNIAEFITEVRKINITPTNLQMLNESILDDQILAFSVTLRGNKQDTRAKIVSAVRGIGCVYFVEEL